MTKRANGEGSWTKQTINGNNYIIFKITVDGERKAFYGKSRTEARNKYKDYLEKTQKIGNKKTALTLFEVAGMMLEYKKAQIKPTTYDSYRYEVEALEKTKIGQMQLQAIDAIDLQRHIDSLTDKKAYASIKNTKLVLNMTYNHAIGLGIMKENPMAMVKMPNRANVKKETRQPVFLTTEERLMIEQEAKRTKKNGSPFYTGNSAYAIVFILHTGLRISELVALMWEDVDFKNRRIHISRNAPISRNYGDGPKYSAKITTPKKKASNRTVPLDDVAFGIIETMNKGLPSEFVFPNMNGDMLNRRNVSRTLDNIVSRTKITKKPSVHDLRHTYASELIRNGIDVKTVSTVLGHEDVSTTLNIYVHKNDDDLDILKNVLKS